MQKTFEQIIAEMQALYAIIEEADKNDDLPEHARTEDGMEFFYAGYEMMQEGLTLLDQIEKGEDV